MHTKINETNKKTFKKKALFDELPLFFDELKGGLDDFVIFPLFLKGSLAKNS